MNEWFVMTAELTNHESFPANDVIIEASLTEASDPIISDTTRLVLDFKMPEPATPMTPTDMLEKFSFKFSYLTPWELNCSLNVIVTLRFIHVFHQFNIKFYILKIL